MNCQLDFLHQHKKIIQLFNEHCVRLLNSTLLDSHLMLLYARQERHGKSKIKYTNLIVKMDGLQDPPGLMSLCLCSGVRARIFFRGMVHSNRSSTLDLGSKFSGLKRFQRMLKIIQLMLL